jgi:soluble lytic murein transglycosylase
MIKGMLHRKNTKLINKLSAALFLAATMLSAPSLSKPAKNTSSPKKVVPAADLSAEDKLFVELREAAKVNDVAKTRTLGSKLESHDLSDYVLYYQIKPQIYDKGAQARVDSSADAAVEAFLKVNAGTAIADRLRNDWLLVLGKMMTRR